MDIKRMIEVIKARLNDELCCGCEKYGHIPTSCNKCAELTSKYIIEILKEKINETD